MKDWEQLPNISPKQLWQFSISEFNEWRRKYDFPRIVAFLNEKLPHFSDWQNDQKVLTDDLIYFGPARFLKGNPSNLFIIDFDDFGNGREQRIIGYKSTVRYYNDNIERYGNFSCSNEIIPYFKWIRQKNHIPKNRSYGGDLWGQSISEVKNGANVSTSLPLVKIGDIKLENINISGFNSWENPEIKNFEFLSLDRLHLNKCTSHNPLKLNFCSADELTIENSRISEIHAYNSSILGFNVENCILTFWSLENCRIWSQSHKIENISNSEIYRWKVANTPFFQHYKSLNVKDCNFVYKKNEEEEFQNIKRIYASQGDFSSAGSFYFKERKAHILRRLDFFGYYRKKIPRKNNVAFSTSFALNRYKFWSKEYSNFEATIDFLKLVFYKTKLLLTPKYFLLLIRNYVIVLGLVLDYLIRGFGEKPFWIIRSSIILILIFASIDFLLFDVNNITPSFIQNAQNFIGNFDYENLEGAYPILKISESLLGIFLISLFVADFSSKRKY
ncbi:hypothetical protein LB465_08700 [Salegentibacter sp. LM13S]|uniref:hypothetical protein n=1 Tax=Salegentibacter lacus TaxID=2873599 RepID=UPI001CCC1DA1|nr:hypothetical protein [Salegentibacter lacus]MBZ9630857.1 hypothetical protein [Salegentibacter lacus]